MRKLISLTFIIVIVLSCSALSDVLNLSVGDIPSLVRAFPSDPDKFSFAIIGDKTGGGQENWHIFDRAMEEINLLNPDFAITVGDHIQGYVTDPVEIEKMWYEYYMHLSKLKIPVLLVPGNHDISNKIMHDYWSRRRGKTYYSFDYKKCHFIVINTEEDKAEDANGAEQKLIDFVINDIRQNKGARHIFLFMHKPIWVDGNKLWKHIEPELKGTKYTVFAGHDHRLLYENRDESHYIIIGATGAGLGNYPEVAELGVFHQYSIVSVEGDEVSVAIIRPGSIFPPTVSTRTHAKNVNESLPQIRLDIPSLGGSNQVTGKLTVTEKNKTDKGIKVKITIMDTKGWKVTPTEKILELFPGEEKVFSFDVTCNEEASSNPLKYVVERYYENKFINKEEHKIELMSKK